jgi:hypothetical protein
MRLSEKTLEINYCSQLQAICPNRIIWFGLTQIQEARAGFDVATRLGGRILLFQFKASDYILRNGSRRFYLKHDQLINLQNHVNSRRRSIFYVFPLLGTTQELSRNSNIIDQSYLLDVATLPNLAIPTKRNGQPRQNKIHYADINPPSIVIHSDPIELKLESSENVAKSGFHGSDGAIPLNIEFEEFWRKWKLNETFSYHSKGAVLLR